MIDRKADSSCSCTFNICACGEETSLACEDSEDGCGMFIEFSESGNGVDHETAAEGIECFWAIELGVC
jgi:hypothetical protein